MRRYGWSVREALLACTLNAAWVLGLSGELGSLEVGKRADVVLLDTPVAHLPYRFGRNPVCLVVRAGEVVVRAPGRRVEDLVVIARGDLARRLADLEPIGLDERGTTRLAWTPEDEAAGAWFARRAEEVGLRVEVDPAGNRWALPDAPGPWWGVGSHLDSVRAGGRYDGALGVCAAFAVAEHAPVAVIAFADEEGARFNTPTFGSRALAGVARSRRPRPPRRRRRAPGRRDGRRRRRSRRASRRRRRGSGACAASWSCTSTRPPTSSASPVVRALAARMRVQADLHGRADHAGTTRRHERSDALLRAAILIVAAHQRATDDMVVTASRILVEPNALTTIASHVRLWLDARSENPVGAHRLVPGPARRAPS